MPDPQDNTAADEETLPDSSLHAYKDEDRHDQMGGDVDSLRSGDADQMSPEKREDDDEPDLPKH